MYMCGYICVHAQRSEVNLRCSSSGAAILSFKIRSLTGLVLAWYLSSRLSWLASVPHPTCHHLPSSILL